LPLQYRAGPAWSPDALLTLFAPLRFEIALHLRQGQRLDQQALSFVAAATPAEAHDDSPSFAFRLYPPRQQRVARWQEREISETNATKAAGPGSSIISRLPVPPQR
jgi:hypothetical protein